MAKASWAVVSPERGSGSKTVNVSSNETHTGRVARTTTLTIEAANVVSQKVSVNQAGKPEFTDAMDTATANKDGQTVTISGKSNSKRLTFSLGDGTLSLTLPSSYTAAGWSTVNGAEIRDDPGAVAEYDWSITFDVAANIGTEEKYRQIIVTDEAGHPDICVLTQAAGSATLTVSKTSLELGWEGSPVSFDITSNTSWSIS